MPRPDSLGSLCLRPVGLPLTTVFPVPRSRLSAANSPAKASASATCSRWAPKARPAHATASSKTWTGTCGRSRKTSARKHPSNSWHVPSPTQSCGRRWSAASPAPGAAVSLSHTVVCAAHRLRCDIRRYAPIPTSRCGRGSAEPEWSFWSRLIPWDAVPGEGLDTSSRGSTMRLADPGRGRPAAARQPQGRPMLKLTVAVREPMRKMRGTHAAGVMRKKPPA
jgi:hypothetical protein